MRVLIAPDKFAGTLSAQEAAREIAAGWRRVRPDDELVLLPLADGGPGTIDAMAAGRNGSRRRVAALDPMGRPITADWWLGPSGVGVVEVAATCGLHLLSPDERDPGSASSAGLGDVLADVARVGARELVIGLGGTATVDGGAGAIRRLGGRFLTRDGATWTNDAATELVELGGVGPLPRALPPARLASDVRNPLLGPDGAARVFGPQKGADSTDVERLEAALARLADVAERDLDGGPWRDRAGAGAAGGLGFGLMAWADAEAVSGAELVGHAVGLEAAVVAADVVITGEGGLDAQTAQGKVPEHVRLLARAAARPVLALAGVIEQAAAARYDDHAELGPEGLVRPAARCREAAAELANRRT